MYIGINVKYRSGLILMKLESSPQIFKKYSSIKFHENPSSGSRGLSYGRSYMTKLVVGFRSFANAPQSDVD